uniref:Ubiquitin-like protease family profile domain-containing protein n=1 Tax=Brassica oleracea var. oleracea TaxID=109376 RepID=A0A0D3CBM6_BRAOL
MSEELPKRLFKEGEEPRVTQINNNCRINYIIRKFQAWLPKELDVVKKDPVFYQIFKLHENGLGYSARVIHSFLLTGFECDTRISLEEFEEWKYDGGFWSKVLRRKDGTITLFNLWTKDKEAVKKWRNADRIRLIYLAIILCVVLARDEKANIPLKYITVVMDLDKIWAMEAVPKIGKLCGKKLDKGFKNSARCINWMGAAKVSYEEIIWLEQIITPEDDIYAYISWTGNYDVAQAQAFRRDDEVEDDRIKVLMELIKNGHDFSEHVWETEENEVVSLSRDDESAVNDEASVNVEATESDEDFQTPKGSKNVGSRSKKGKKRLPDRGMEKRKHKVLSSGPKQEPFNEDMKVFVTQLFEHNFSGMEQRLQKQMDETFEQMQIELKDSRKEASVEVELGEPSPTKPSTSQTPLRRSRFVSVLGVYLSLVCTQRVEGLSQASYVPGFDPSQTKKEDDWWTPMTLVEEKVNDFSLAIHHCPKMLLRRRHSTRVVSAGKWLGNEEMDAVMFIWRVNTTLNRWAPRRVAFMSAMFCLQLDAAYQKFLPNKKAYQLPDFLLGYGRGEHPSHGRTDLVWGVDVDRLYFPLSVNGNHWIGVCVNIIERKVEVFDCGRGKNRQYVEKFAAIIPRIVKAVGPPERQKQLLLSSYSIVDVPMKMRLNKICCDCGAYALKHLEYSLLGLDVSLVDDEIIMGCRQKI